MKIDFEGYKFAIASNDKLNLSVFHFNNLSDLRVTDDFYITSISKYGRKANTLHTNPDYKESKDMIYTQEMFDNGEVPHIGMMFICKEKTSDSRISDFMGKAVKVVGVSNLDGNEVITFHHTTLGIGCGVFGEEWVKPIDTRTDEEKAVDDLYNNEYFDKEQGPRFLEDIKAGKIHGVSFTGDKK